MRYLTRKTQRESDHSIVRLLYRLREERGLTRLELAVMIGWDNETLGRRERGDISPTLTELSDWCQALGVSPELSVRVDRPMTNGHNVPEAVAITPWRGDQSG